MSVTLCFPSPLPDETIYSLFCRYHVRSCNASDRATIHQLFNKTHSLQTTVFSAFPLKYAMHWVDSFHGLSVESLIENNTAMPFYRIFKPRTNISCCSYASDRFLMSMYNNCCTHSKKLRYCPKCAKAQWEAFGVSYWQILPQINGYEVCHKHGELIRETSISHSDVRYKFFPALTVISHDDKQAEDTGRLKYIEKNHKKFLQMAKNIDFLFRFSYPGFLLSEKIRFIIAHGLLPIHHRWLLRMYDDPVLFECIDYQDSDRFYEIFEDTYTFISQFQCLPICLQIYLCQEMFGGVCNVCEA